MTGRVSTPINLNKVRKAKARAAAKTKADRNAVVFGRDGTTKKRDLLTEKRAQALWSAHRKDSDDTPSR